MPLEKKRRELCVARDAVVRVFYRRSVYYGNIFNGLLCGAWQFCVNRSRELRHHNM